MSAIVKRLFQSRWVPSDSGDRQFGVCVLPKEGVLVLWDRRADFPRRAAEWQGFRNYLFGWSCKVIGEQSASDYAVMVIKDGDQEASPAAMADRLTREFMLLTLDGVCPPDLRHCFWGDVLVENGNEVGKLACENKKIVGVYIGGKITKHPIIERLFRHAA